MQIFFSPLKIKLENLDPGTQNITLKTFLKFSVKNLKLYLITQITKKILVMYVCLFIRLTVTEELM